MFTRPPEAGKSLEDAQACSAPTGWPGLVSFPHGNKILFNIFLTVVDFY